MERLTIEGAIKYIKEVVRKNRRNKEKNTIIIPNSFISSIDCAGKYEQVAKWLEELKSYRDIGTPKELKELKENGAFTGLELAKLAIMQKELKSYKDLEEQGLLVRLQTIKKYIKYLPDGQSVQSVAQDLMNTVVAGANTNAIVKKNIMCVQLIFRL